jgi:hypothetical protein
VGSSSILAWATKTLRTRARSFARPDLPMTPFVRRGRSSRFPGLTLVGTLLAIGLGCSDAAAPRGEVHAESRWPLTPEAQIELDLCLSDHLTSDPDAADSMVRQYTSLCEAMLGIGSAGTTATSWASMRTPTPPPRRPTSVPEPWQRGLCGLERGDGESELVGFLGSVQYRTELAGGGVLLQWEEGSAGVSAQFDRDGLESVVAIQENRFPKATQHVRPPPDWKPGETRLGEVQSVLGEGTLVEVRWERGLPIPLEKARERSIPDDVVTAGCSLRFAWPGLDTGLGPTLKFRDGLLKGVL